LSLVFVFATYAHAQNDLKGARIPTIREKKEPLKVGEIAPDFTLSDLHGKQVKLSKARMPVVLVFYRGYW